MEIIPWSYGSLGKILFRSYLVFFVFNFGTSPGLILGSVQRISPLRLLGPTIIDARIKPSGQTFSHCTIVLITSSWSYLRLIVKGSPCLAAYFNSIFLSSSPYLLVWSI